MKTCHFEGGRLSITVIITISMCFFVIQNYAEIDGDVYFSSTSGIMGYVSVTPSYL